MKFLKHPVFWREKVLTFNTGIASIMALLLQIFPSYSLAAAYLRNASDFFSAFGICWFCCITFGQITAFRTDDIEAIIASPLGIKDFLKGRALFSLVKFFLYSVLFIIIYHSSLISLTKFTFPGTLLFVIYPFFLYNWAIFVNTIGLLVPDRFIPIVSICLILPSLFVSSFSNLIINEMLRSLIHSLMVPMMGILAFISNAIFFRHIPKEAIKNKCLKD